jgi:hypothetical protein
MPQAVGVQSFNQTIQYSTKTSRKSKICYAVKFCYNEIQQSSNSLSVKIKFLYYGNK